MQTLQEKYSKKRVSEYKRDEGTYDGRIVFWDFANVLLPMLLPSFCHTLYTMKTAWTGALRPGSKVELVMI